MSKTYAVITGDIVDSSSLDEKTAIRLGDTLREEIFRLSHYHFHNDGKIEKSEVFRGDSWQFCTDFPVSALIYPIALRTSLRGKHGFDTRFSIGIGEIQKPYGTLVISQGEAFTLSGKGLDKLAKDQRQDIALSADLKTAESFAKASCYLLDALVSSWTDKQCQAVALALSGKPYKELAKQFLPKAISEQAFGKHLAAASWNLVSKSLEAFENALSTQLASK